MIKELYSTVTGNSLTFGLLFPETYEMANTEKIAVYLDNRVVQHTVVDKMIRVELQSDKTINLFGSKQLAFVLDDVSFGVLKQTIGEIKFSNIASTFNNESVNSGYNFVVKLSINETTITTEDVLYEYVKGKDGVNGTTDYNELTNKPDLSVYQTVTDNTLETIEKDIVPAINEVNSIAKGANQALSYDDYQQLIIAMETAGLNTGQNLYVDTFNVPDLWVKVVETTNVPYAYVSDDQFVTDILAGTQIGYYRLSLLETQKVDLTNYYTKDETDQAIEDYAEPLRTTDQNYVSDAELEVLRDTSGVNTGNETQNTIGDLIELTELETVTDTTKIAASDSAFLKWFSGLTIYTYIRTKLLAVANTWALLQTFTNGLKTTKIIPNSDTTGVVIRNAADTADVVKITTEAGIIGYSKQPISISYADLYALTQSAGLTVGQRYIINDYQTVHTIPNTSDTNTGQVEPLLVEAITVNKLKNECYSTLFPQDIIYYDIENNQSMVPGCTKGYIYRRIDTKKNNDIGFDYRNVKFRRWQLNVTVEDVDGDNNTYTKGSVVKKTGTNEVYIKLNNVQGLFIDTDKWKRFEFNNLTYIIPQESDWYLIDDDYQVVLPVNSSVYYDYHMFSTEPTISGIQSSYAYIYNNKIDGHNSEIVAYSDAVFFGNTFYSNTIGDNFNYNTIGNYFNSNTIGNYFNYNTIGNYFNSNTIGNYFNSNTIGEFFNYNTIGDNFNYNTIGNYFYSNTIGDNFYSNTIGDNFNYNTIGNYFNSNTIGNYFYSNTIGNYFNSNTIGNKFNSNTIGEFFNYNTIGDNFNYNTIGNYFYSNTIGNYFNSNTIGNNFNSNTIGEFFNYNTIGDNFNYNTIGEFFKHNTIGNNFNYNGGLDFTSSTYVYQGYNKELFTNSNNMQYLKYYDENNVLQIVVANA